MKNVLITGSSGFLGNHLVQHVNNATAKAANNPPEFNYNSYKFFTPPSHQLNCIDYKELYYYCYYNNIDSIIHLAAECGGIGINQRKPADFFLNNAQMSLNVIKVTHELEIAKTVTLGTVCSYPKHTPVPFKEEDLWNGYPEETNAPYGLAKKNLLVGGQAFHQQYNRNIIHLIPVNMYGEHDHFDLENSHVIPAMLRKFHEAKLNNEMADKPDPVNIGAAKETSIKDLAEIIKKLVNYEGEITWDVARPNGQPRRCLDTAKAKQEFGFEASTPLEEGLKRTYDWYLNSLNN